MHVGMNQNTKHSLPRKQYKKDARARFVSVNERLIGSCMRCMYRMVTLPMTLTDSNQRKLRFVISFISLERPKPESSSFVHR